ncbi:MAG: NB-ARC domain-containing protein [Limnospira sp.]
MNVETALAIADRLVFSKTDRHLSTVQMEIFRGSWAGQKYADIAAHCYCSETHIRIVGSELWNLLSQGLEEKVTKKTFRATLERYNQQESPPEPTPAETTEAPSPPPAAPQKMRDWGEAPDVSVFFGRTEEQEILERWIATENVRLVTLLGMGGIGKTSLAAKTILALETDFDLMIWRSLRNAPAVEDILADLIQFLGNSQQVSLPQSPDGRIRLVLDFLRNRRCLLVLDNVESILQGGDRTGRFRAGYEGYGQLFRAIGETQHRSCLILTSREKPAGLSALEGENRPVRCLPLIGLPSEAGQAIFETKGSFSGTEADWQLLTDRYAGNPLALNIVASAIRDFFEGNLGEFLEVIRQGAFIFDDIRDLLDSQFERLTELEQAIVYWLAIEREPVPISELREDFVAAVSPQDLLQAIASLQRRSFLEKVDNCFTQQPVVMEYATDRFIDRVCEEILTQNIALLQTHALIEAQTKDYIRDTQINLILQPTLDRLKSQLGSEDAIAAILTEILDRERQKPARTVGYLAGNLLNLFRQGKIDIGGYDFSNLTISQAYLQGMPLRNVDFTGSDLSKCVFTETLGNILSAAFSPDGKILATCDTDCNVRLWEVKTGKLLGICEGHANWVRSVAFSPDGEILASGGADHTVKFWNVRDGICLKTCTDHENEVFSVAFGPDSQTVASSSGDGTVRLWNRLTGECLQTCGGHESWIRAVAFSPDGKRVASGGDDRTVKLWDACTGDCLNTLDGHGGWVRAVAFGDGGKILATGSGDRTVKLWDVRTGDCIATYSGHGGGIYSLSFSPDGRILASGSGDSTVRLWDIQTGECVKTLYGHTNQIFSVAFSPDGYTLVCVSLDQRVRLWDTRTGRCLKTWYGHTDWALPVAFCPRGYHLASGSNDPTVKLWNYDTGEYLRALQGHRDFIYALAFSPDGQILASGSTDNTVRLWDVDYQNCFQILHGHGDWVYGVAFDPDSRTLVTVSADNTVKLWDLKTGQCLKTMLGHAEKILGVAFSPDGGRIASCCSAKTVRLWDVKTGECLKVLLGHTNRVYSVAFHPDGKRLVSGSTDKTLKVWDLESGGCLKTLEGHENWVFAVSWSPDGKAIASASHDRTVRIWDFESGTCRHVCAGHEHLVSSVAFSPEGKMVASGSQDQTVRLWDVETGNCLKILRATRLYEGMKIGATAGLTVAQQMTLKTLGAIGF